MVQIAKATNTCSMFCKLLINYFTTESASSDGSDELHDTAAGSHVVHVIVIYLVILFHEHFNHKSYIDNGMHACLYKIIGMWFV